MELLLLGKLLGVAFYAGLEYWLGKTDAVKAGSVIEAIGNGVTAVARRKKKQV